MTTTTTLEAVTFLGNFLSPIHTERGSLSTLLAPTNGFISNGKISIHL
jgi:hypothetical protein